MRIRLPFLLFLATGLLFDQAVLPASAEVIRPCSGNARTQAITSEAGIQCRQHNINLLRDSIVNTSSKYSKQALLDCLRDLGGELQGTRGTGIPGAGKAYWRKLQSCKTIGADAGVKVSINSANDSPEEADDPGDCDGACAAGLLDEFMTNNPEPEN
ncbi:MAG: hypothetical protein P4L98_05565 [Ancalomicrobiaceae bacterium]|nr:hypothetical protein [Ancalomicrobiaceae bacterium]